MKNARFINCETCQSEGRILTSDGGPDDKDHGVCPECNGKGVVPAGLPSTAVEIVGLIRSWRAQGFTVSHDEAVELIEQYAAVVAAEASIKATSEAHDRTMVAFDEAMSKPLVSPRPDTAVSP